MRFRTIAWYVVWVGGYALAAYEINDRALTPVLVCCAGLAYPIEKFWHLQRKSVSPEQADQLVQQIKSRSRASARRRGRSLQTR